MRKSRSSIASLCVLGLIVAQAGASAETPSEVAAPPSLPVIGRTHSRGFCSTVRSAIAPAVLALMKNDELIGTGRQTFAKMSRDRTQSALPGPEFNRHADIDRVYLGKLVQNMAHNLGVMRTILSDDKQFPRSASVADDHLSAQIREKLKALAEQQNDTLNVIDGMLETELAEQMMGELDSGMKAATGPIGRSNGGASGFASGGSFMAVPVSIFDPRKLGTSDLLGHKRYDRVVDSISAEQKAISTLENVVTPSIIAAANECRTSARPEPSPSP